MNRGPSSPMGDRLVELANQIAGREYVNIPHDEAVRSETRNPLWERKEYPGANAAQEQII